MDVLERAMSSNPQGPQGPEEDPQGLHEDQDSERTADTDDDAEDHLLVAAGLALISVLFRNAGSSRS
jgi:hypothetical protein